MSWSTALAAIADTFREVFQWKTGGREQEANRLREEEERLNAAYKKALVQRDCIMADSIYHELRRVRDKARSRRAGA